MLVTNWKRGKDTPLKRGVTLEKLIHNYDNICQIAGNANNIDIGSDLDGCFGTEQTPSDHETIADLQKLQGLLTNRGYSEDDIKKVFHGNWLRFLRKAWR